MGLFTKFEDTIFLKRDSNLEKQIDALENLKKVNTNTLIDRDLLYLKAGYRGEKSLEFELENNNIGMYVMHDVNLIYEDLCAQIDYVVVTCEHCYLIECKNMIGNITVNQQGQFIREFTYHNKKTKEAIYSPYTQAFRHKDILKKIWGEGKNGLTKTIMNPMFEDYYKPLVVFVNPKGILNIKNGPKEIKNITIRGDQINDYIRKDIQKKKNAISQKQMRECAKAFLKHHQDISHDYTSKYNHKNQENTDANKNIIKEKLIAFRKEKARNQNYPAYYIFTNHQLEQLLDALPEDMEALKELNILEPVKYRLHGQEIIQIIHSSKADE